MNENYEKDRFLGQELIDKITKMVDEYPNIEDEIKNHLIFGSILKKDWTRQAKIDWIIEYFKNEIYGPKDDNTKPEDWCNELEMWIFEMNDDDQMCCPNDNNCETCEHLEVKLCQRLLFIFIICINNQYANIRHISIYVNIIKSILTHFLLHNSL
jgi:hypothetical protein